MKALLLAVLLCLACTPKHPTPAGVAIVGERISPQEAADIDERLRRVRVCLRERGIRIKNRVEEIRVHPGCSFVKAGHTVAGWTNLRDGFEIERRLIEVEHEGAATMVGSHGHFWNEATNTGHPSMVCGEPLKRAWFSEHPRPQCPTSTRRGTLHASFCIVGD